MEPNSGHVYRHRVRAAEAGRTVLELHVERFRHSDRDTWIARIRAGLVRRNGRGAELDELVREGDELEFHREPWVEPDAPRTFGVVYEDEHVLAVDKPSGLQVLPAGPFSATTLLSLVRASAPARREASAAHRLGRGTSGLVLFGKTAVARAGLARQFRERAPCKTYLAIAEPAEGGVERMELPRSARHPIGLVPHGPIDLWVAAPHGKPSQTRLRVLARDRARNLLLVAAQPVTGRADQIRIHLAACGAPLAGDLLFGPGGVAKSNATPGSGGYRLHAVALGFAHPATGERVRLRCYPKWPELAGFARERD